MNLLYTLTAYPPSTGGTQLHVHLLAQQLNTKHHVEALCFWDSNRTDWLLGTTLYAHNQQKDYTFEGITVHRLSFGWNEKATMLPFVAAYYPLMDIAVHPIAYHIERQMKRYVERADLIHNVRIGREGLSMASLNAARKRDIPFILTSVHPRVGNRWEHRVYRHLYRQADAVIALTEIEKQALMEIGVKEEQIVVTGIGPVIAPKANPDAFLRKYDINGPVILFLGQHYAHKGYRQLLDATRLVWKKEPEAQFVFIGPPIDKSEANFMHHADLRIQRLGQVSLQEKTDALAACTLLCLPSTEESFGGVYTEAWSFGKPVIGCNIPPVSEVIKDGVNGFLIEQDVHQIADRILQLLRNPQLAAQMGNAGMEKVTSRYTWSALAALTEQTYLKVLNGKC